MTQIPRDYQGLLDVITFWTITIWASRSSETYSSKAKIMNENNFMEHLWKMRKTNYFDTLPKGGRVQEYIQQCSMLMKAIKKIILNMLIHLYVITVNSKKIE